MEKEVQRNLAELEALKQKELEKEQDAEKWRLEAESMRQEVEKTKDELEIARIEAVKQIEAQQQKAALPPPPVEEDLESMELGGPGENDRSEEDRLTAQMKDKELQRQLEKLKSELASLKDQNKNTDMDVLHQENVKAGRDKYKTLKQIRCGNTKQRIDEFEAL